MSSDNGSIDCISTRVESHLAGSHETVKLELPRAWEPLDMSKPSQDCEGTSSHCLFSYGDKTGQGRV